MLTSLRIAGAFTISAAFAGGSGALLAAGCSASEGANAFGCFDGCYSDGGASDANSDGGVILDGAANDSSDEGDATDGGQPRRPPHIVVVHASPELWPFRVCLGDSSSLPTSTTPPAPRHVAPWPDDPSHPAPMSNYPAVALGSGALWVDAGASTAEYVIPYVLDAQQIANSSSDMAKTCDQLVCGGGSCLEQVDGWNALDAIDIGTLSSSTTYLLVVSGCRGGMGSIAECGADYDATKGNLHATWIPLIEGATGTISSVQLAQLSPNFGAATITSEYADDASLASSLQYLHVAPPAMLSVPSPAEAGAYAVDTLTATGDAGSLTLSLADITQLTDPSLLPSDLFASGASLLVGIVGDPSSSVAQIDAGASYDGHGLHMIAVPMSPAPDAGM